MTSSKQVGETREELAFARLHIGLKNATVIRADVVVVKLEASKSGSFQDRRISRRDRAEPPGAVVVNCLADLGLAVHHKRPVTDNWLVDRLAGQHQQD